jgi:hypothetical protein
MRGEDFISQWLAPMDGESFGPKCPLHKERHMARTSTQEYTCTHSGQIFTLRECLDAKASETCIGAAYSASTAPRPAGPMPGRDLVWFTKEKIWTP